MRRLSLDYVQPAFRSSWPGLIILTLALFWAGNLIVKYLQTAEDIAAQTQVISDVVVPRNVSMNTEPVRTPAQIQRLKQDIEQANRIIAQLTLPWEELFNAVESAQNRDIALLDIQPDPGTKSLNISGEARNFAALSGYLLRVQSQRCFSNVFLLKHEVQAEDPQHPIRFELKADWVVS